MTRIHLRLQRFLLLLPSFDLRLSALYTVISTERLKDPIPSPDLHKDQVLTWSWCEICQNATPVMPVNKDVCVKSFWQAGVEGAQAFVRRRVSACVCVYLRVCVCASAPVSVCESGSGRSHHENAAFTQESCLFSVSFFRSRFRHFASASLFHLPPTPTGNHNTHTHPCFRILFAFAQTWQSSLGKFLEVSFYARDYVAAGGICPHSHHRHHVRYFGKVSPRDVLSACLGNCEL